MLSTEDRIRLRNILFDKFKELKIIFLSNDKTFYKIPKHEDDRIVNKLINDIDLQYKYMIYINEFRSETEALYCLTHLDDFSNHICPICKTNLCNFYINKKRSHYQYKQSCCNENCVDKLIYTDDTKHKREETKERIYGDKNYTNRKKAEESNLNRFKSKYVMQTEKGKERWRRSYYKNHNITDLNNENIIQTINKIDCNLNLIDIYSNNDYFIQFIDFLFQSKNDLLRFSEIGKIFNRSNQTIENRAKELHILNQYFYLQDSPLELQFKNLLQNYNITYERHNRSILDISDSNGHPELDFYLKDYNICFEIDDVKSHNITIKDMNYHYNKTLQCLQKDIRLIHIWEWELNDQKIQNWILHILNQNKIQLNIFNDDNYDIRLVNKEEVYKFFTQYSLTNYKENRLSLGIYYNNELIQVLSFNIKELNIIISICVKFGYNIVIGTREIIESFKRIYNTSFITTYIDLSKFTGKTFEELGFKLTNYIQPFIISEEPNEISNYKHLYNCGYNEYVI